MTLIGNVRDTCTHVVRAYDGHKNDNVPGFSNGI